MRISDRQKYAQDLAARRFGVVCNDVSSEAVKIFEPVNHDGWIRRISGRTISIAMGTRNNSQVVTLRVNSNGHIRVEHDICTSRFNVKSHVYECKSSTEATTRIQTIVDSI